MYKIISYFSFLFKSTNQHGVHSPFVYDLVTKCFYDKKKFSELQLISTKSNKLIAKCLHYFDCKEVAFSTQQSIDLFNKAFTNISVCSLDTIRETTSIVVIDKIENKEVFQQQIALMSKDSLVIVRLPHQSKKHTLLWQEILGLEEVRLSIDTFHLGFIFFRTEQAEQNFIIRA